MKKREKRKKEKQAKDPNILDEVENKDVKTEKDGSKSRSRSRGRRSLSNLFRRTNNRNESSDRLEKNEHIDQPSNENERDINLRSDPRGYLKRMTVREALVYDRKRGRSPNRRTKTLEKKILDKVPSFERESLSVSLPHLLDQIEVDQSNEPETSSTSVVGRSGSTLPRKKKRRGNSEETHAQTQNSETNSNVPDRNSHILPLDKRKYLIHKNSNSYLENEHSVRESEIDIHNADIMHSNHELNSSIPVLSETEQRRRDTFNQFLALRETNPLHTSVHGNVNYCPTENTESQELTENAVVSSDPVEYKEGNTAKFKSETGNENEESSKAETVSETIENQFRPISSETYDTNPVIIPIPSNTDEDKTRRSSYISPRRFSRTSRNSVTSNKSNVSDSNVPVFPDIKATSPLSSETNPERQKYQRHFSRESRKRRKENLKNDSEKRVVHSVDASTSMDDLYCPVPVEFHVLKPEVAIPVEAIEPVDIMPLSVPQDSSGSFVACIENKHKNEKEVDIENEIPQTDVKDMATLHRDVIVIDKDSDRRIIPNEESNHVFIPIDAEAAADADENSADNKTVHEIEEVLKHDDNEIQVLASNIPVEDEIVDIKTAEKGKNKIKEQKSKKQDKNKAKDTKSDLETKSKTSVKKEKKMSRKKKEKKEKSRKPKDEITVPNSESVEKQDISNETSRKDENEVTSDKKVPKFDSAKTKSRKGILKKTQKKSKHQKAKLNRAASLNSILDERESKRLQEKRRSIPMLEKRSKSLDDLAEKNRKPHKIAKKDKKEFEKLVKKDIAAKESRPQPKLSIAAIVALRTKIARMKKAKHQNAAKDFCVQNEEVPDKDKVPSSNMDSDGTNENNDMSVAKIFYENEINTSIGKSENSLEIIEDTDKEVKDLVYDKRIKFAPYCDDALSEEEMIAQRQRNTRLTSRRESKVRQRQKKVINCCKKFIAFLFSHIGLCSLVVAYCILGGMIFQSLEGDYETAKKKEIQALRQNFTEKIHRLAFETTLTKGSREKFKTEVDAILKNFSVIIHKQTKEAGWDGKEVRVTRSGEGGSEEMVAEPEQWSYPSSLLYAITVMTTIGYGHVAPKTDEGRIVTIAYAVLGIPLTLLCLTNIGDVLAKGFRMLYGKVCCGLCCILFRPPRRRRMDPEKGLTPDEERMITQGNEKSGEVIQVPTSVCLVLMSSYIMLGTFLFSEWENWDFVTGTYFCFITLSTIGFGDVVPGMSATDWDQNEKLVSCALYLVFGLSLIAMCFNLVQEDVKAKFKWLGMKLGIIDKPVSSV